MALADFLHLIPKLFIIITVVSLNNDAVKNGLIASAELLVRPLWDVSENISNPCIVNDASDDEVIFTGSVVHSCTLQVNASEGTSVQLKMHGLMNDTLTDSFMYVEHDEPHDCPDKYIVFNDVTEPCNYGISARFLKLILYGDVSVSISGISTTSTSPQCLEHGEEFTDERQNQSYDCDDVQSYRSKVMCTYYTDYDYYYELFGLCMLDFDIDCNVTLGPREVIYECDSQDEYENHRAFIPYPDVVPGTNTMSLNLVSLTLYFNKITKLHSKCFQGLSKLKALKLSYNRLRALQSGVFQNLQNLEVMDLSWNQIRELDEKCFKGLKKLNKLILSNNRLRALQGGVFQNLQNLEIINFNRNQISELDAHFFQGLMKLVELQMYDNNLRALNSGIFRNLQHLEVMDLSSNQISELDVDCFQGLNNLKELKLSYNSLRALEGDIFHNLQNLEVLYLYGNQISVLDAECFKGLNNVKEIHIQGNVVKSVLEGTFQNLSALQKLKLYVNQIEQLKEGCFQGLSNLTRLILNENRLSSLPEGIFYGLNSLEYLDLSNNQISFLPEGCFLDLFNLEELDLSKNILSSLSERSFQNLYNLEELDLKDNQISQLNSGQFYGLKKVKVMWLNVNMLRFLPEGLFQETTFQYLSILDLSDNQLRSLSKGIFQDLRNLQILYIRLNHISRLIAGCFEGLLNITYLFLESNPLSMISNGSFSFLPSDVQLRVDRYEICECFLPSNYIYCMAEDSRSPYLTCDRLLSDRTLAIFMWLIAFNAFGGNFFVLIWRSKVSSKNKVNSILLSNLATADLFMGIYMFIIGSADIYFGDYFPMQAKTWRASITCRIAGALSIISSEASVFFVMLISVDRFICIRFPYSAKKLSKKTVTGLASLTWLVSLVLGTVPSVLAGRYVRFYDTSHVCIGLPLTLASISKRDPQSADTIYVNPAYISHEINGHYYSTALFLGVNSVCYLVVIGCYIEIVRAVKRASKKAGRSPDMSEQLKLTKKVTAIVATDFFCWAPIIILGILRQARVIDRDDLPASVFAWSVTFVMPINSAINPYLYTINEVISECKKKKMERDEKKQLYAENLRMKERRNAERGESSEPRANSAV